MSLIKSLAAPIRRIVQFPLVQFAVTVAVILWLQAADSNSAFGEIFNALDWLVDFSVKQCTALFNVRSFTRSWLTAGFMMGYVYLVGLVIVFLARMLFMAVVELMARMNAFGLRNAIARDRGIAAYRAWLPYRPRSGNSCVPRMVAAGKNPAGARCAAGMGGNVRVARK